MSSTKDLAISLLEQLLSEVRDLRETVAEIRKDAEAAGIA